jgi:hypothetical protein
VTFDRPVAESYVICNDQLISAIPAEDAYTYYYDVLLPMSKGKEEGTFMLCIYENDTQSTLAEYTYKKEAALFLGIYLNPFELDMDAKPYSVTVPAGQGATVYLAVTACVDPTSLELALGGSEGYELEPLQNPWLDCTVYADGDGDPMHVWIYEVYIPSQYLTPGEPETVNPQKLFFEQSNGGTSDYYDDDISWTYVINIAE